MPSLSSALSKIKRVGSLRDHSPLSVDLSHRQKLHDVDAKGRLSTSSSSSSEQQRYEDNSNPPLSKNQLRKRQTGRRGPKGSTELQRQDAARQWKEADELAQSTEPAEIRARYGDLPLIQSRERNHDPLCELGQISSETIGQEVIFRARVHAVRKLSANLAFLVFQHRISTLQGVMIQRDGVITRHMVRWAERIPAASIVVVKGQVRKPEQQEGIKGCTIHDVEVLINEIHVISRRNEPVPFTAYENEVSADHVTSSGSDEQHINHITDRTRLAHRVLDLRTMTSNAIFRVNSGICNLFRSYLDSQGFIEIHTPKLQGGATESGASVFQLDYFGRPAFLAQSPQLAKQMSIVADFERVYEIGPVFRAENSNTHRHLTEYTGLDLEMVIEEHYHEALDVIDATLKFIFRGIYDRFRQELEIIKHHFPHEDLVWLEHTPRIPFKEGVQMLIDSGWTDENGKPPSPFEDLGTREEIRLGELVKEIHHTDFYILDKFPAAARPFYTMPDPQDSKITNSFDIFIRGQEIISGGQRIHDAKMLEEQMKAMRVDPASMKDYVNSFKYASPPHAGAGFGLERIVMLILTLGNIRFASLFPRDPKSLPPQPPAPDLRHLDDSTLNPPWGDGEPPDEEHMQPLENLIANYGDSTNTSWTDDRYKIWRHRETGAAVSYVPTNNHAILPGNPLCDISQYTTVVAEFLRWLKKETHLKPIWILVGHEMEEVLGANFGWKTLTCVAEERIDATKQVGDADQNVARKIRHAAKEGVKIINIPVDEPVPDDVQAQCEARIRDWRAHRHGKQIHLSEITPWRDMAHRRYFCAQDANGRICALVVLAQLARRHGYQVKYSFDFPDAPSGTIEYITLHSIKAAKASGTKILTFGSAATSELHAVHHLSGARVKMMQQMYESIAKQFKLTQKSEFRQKLGGEEDPVYICYPPRGMGVSGSRAIIDFFESDH